MREKADLWTNLIKKIFSMGYISIDVELAWGVVGVSEGGGVPSKGIGDTCHG
jgi:hypothetical protein